MLVSDRSHTAFHWSLEDTDTDDRCQLFPDTRQYPVDTYQVCHKASPAHSSVQEEVIQEALVDTGTRTQVH